MTNPIVMLGRIVLPSDNTPVKSVGDTLVPSPRWRYKGPASSITLTYQVGRWGVGGFAGDTAIITETLSQPASDTWQEFSPTRALRGVILVGLAPTDDKRYDMEMWFKSPDFSDQGAIFTNCCEVPAVAAELEIVSCSFS
ncbi:hypothetical protein ES703_00348 [subsurface metagenome]